MPIVKTANLHGRPEENLVNFNYEKDGYVTDIELKLIVIEIKWLFFSDLRQKKYEEKIIQKKLDEFAKTEWIQPGEYTIVENKEECKKIVYLPINFYKAAQVW